VAVREGVLAAGALYHWPLVLRARLDDADVEAPSMSTAGRITFVAHPPPVALDPSAPRMSWSGQGLGFIDVVCGSCRALVIDGALSGDLTVEWLVCSHCKRDLQMPYPFGRSGAW
jgi:hypothetical protein